MRRKEAKRLSLHHGQWAELSYETRTRGQVQRSHASHEGRSKDVTVVSTQNSRQRFHTRYWPFIFITFLLIDLNLALCFRN